MDRTDRLMGMFAAFALGDALGAPHEFRENKCNIYTGKLELQAFRYNRFQKETKYFEVGGVTDDTEMTLALFQTIKHGIYSQKDACQAYLNWANSGCPHMGKNTRALFYGVKTLRGYENRKNKIFKNTVSQSNGSLMRCSPLVLLDDWRSAAVQDCDLSNPNPINRACSLIYLGWLDCILQENEIESDYTDIDEDTATILREVLDEEDRVLEGKNKGWVLHAFWCCKLALYAESFASLMSDIIERGGDTDTNAAIAAAIYGARVGFEKLKEEQKDNWEILITSQHIKKQIEKGREMYCPTEFLKYFA